jgi:ferredoxin-NADP reductase
VIELVEETPRAKSIVLDLPEWPGHRAGQHVDVRLTAEDGYQAQRSYSIASAPEDGYVVLTVERLEDGEVSPYLVDERVPETSWSCEGRSAISSGTSRSAARCCSSPAAQASSRCGRCCAIAPPREAPFSARLLYSARSLEDVIYRDDLNRLAACDEIDVRLTLTRESPEGWMGHRGRVDKSLLEEVAWLPDEQPLTYVCGPTGFVEAAAGGLVELGHDPGRIRTERFGPT